MKVDQVKMKADIEKYGLYDYSEWSEYLTYEQFEAFNVEYIKVSIGKGLITKEEIIGYIENYLWQYNFILICHIICCYGQRTNCSSNNNDI